MLKNVDWRSIFAIIIMLVYLFGIGWGIYITWTNPMFNIAERIGFTLLMLV